MPEFLQMPVEAILGKAIDRLIDWKWPAMMAFLAACWQALKQCSPFAILVWGTFFILAALAVFGDLLRWHTRRKYLQNPWLKEYRKGMVIWRIKMQEPREVLSSLAYCASCDECFRSPKKGPAKCDKCDKTMFKSNTEFIDHQIKTKILALGDWEKKNHGGFVLI